LSVRRRRPAPALYPLDRPSTTPTVDSDAAIVTLQTSERLA
jgi:hypothetical protein